MSINIYTVLTVYIYIYICIPQPYANISIQHIYLFLMQYKCKRLTSIVFATLDSDRTGSLATQTLYFQ